jgi:hypothetical protein
MINDKVYDKFLIVGIIVFFSFRGNIRERFD